MPLNIDFKQELQKSIAGEIKDDFITRLLYSTDASIYQIEPLGVVFPRSLNDLDAIVELSMQHDVPLLPRGSGSSLGGQAVGEALVIDTTRYLNHILDIDAEKRTATVEPGVILYTLNRQAAPFGLMFGPDPASAERASIGGSVACNATGAHSIVYGMAVDHLVSADVLLSDGARATFGETPVARMAERSGSQAAPTVENALYQAALSIRTQHADLIRRNWPQVWRRASGYNLNYLLPWSPAQPPQWQTCSCLSYPPVKDGNINLSHLIAGSEGTLAVIRSMTLNLVPKPTFTVLGVLTYASVAEACDQAPILLEKNPSAIELIPGEMVRLARALPAYARQLSFVQGNPEAMLVVEFSGDNLQELRKKAAALGNDVLIAETMAQQAQVWGVRKMGLGILNSLPGDAKPLAFVEDIAVPVDKLGTFVRQFEQVMREHNSYANFYAHASAGCLHIRPVISVKGSEAVARLRSISSQVVNLSFALNGVVSGEHGDGIARSEWLEQNFGSEIYQLFRQVKHAADPKNLLNPGKKVDPGAMDANLRYGAAYQVQTWQPFLGFSSHGLAGAIELCNGQGVCRKDFGLMCPSFQALGEEMNSPRGRANLLRAFISGQFPSSEPGEQSVIEALDLCLACKGCKSECPSGVDIARLKFEFLHQYYQNHPHRLRDYLFGNIDRLGNLASPFSGLVNALLSNKAVRRVNERILGLSANRSFPTFVRPVEKTDLVRNNYKTADVLFLLDSFSRDFHPETALSGISVLEACGMNVQILPVVGAGRALTSKGFLDKAKAQAEKLIRCIQIADPQGSLPIVGVEPSETFMLRDEYLDFFAQDEKVKAIARRTWMVDEFLIRPGVDQVPPIHRTFSPAGDRKTMQRILLHGQCVQKAQPPAEDGFPVGAQATIAMLKMAGFEVEMVDSGCCGMAGAFGYEAEHYDLSMRIGEMAVFPAIRSAGDDVLIAASGTSCRAQIKSGTGKVAVHPIVLMENLLSQQV